MLYYRHAKKCEKNLMLRRTRPVFEYNSDDISNSNIYENQ